MKRLFLLGALVALAACGDQSGLPPATTLSPVGANDDGAGYSPDGSRIFWWSRAGNKWQLWQSPADMSAPTMLPVLSYATTELSWSPDGSRFLIGVMEDPGAMRMLMVNASGTEARRVTTSDNYEAPIAWNPDGKRISFFSVIDGQLVTMVMDVDGGTPTRLIPEETRPHFAAWSPDGSLLAVQVFDAGQTYILLADGDGSNLRPLTTEGFEDMGGPTGWSPDGSSLLYVSTRTGAGDIWVAPVDGSPPRQLTNDVRADTRPFWSPDGRWVAFQSERGLQTDLWVVPAAGGAAERITDDALREELGGWRPGTDEVAYTTGRTLATVWEHTLADGAERQLTPDSVEVSWFNLSSTGELEVTINRGGGVSDFTVMPLSGGEPRTVLANAGGSAARWSPDGSMLAFSSDRGGSDDIWVIDAAGGAPRPLTRWPGSEIQPTWSPDGSAIYFRADREATFGDVWRVPAAGGDPVRITTTAGVLTLCGQVHPSPSLFVVMLGDGPSTFAAARIREDGSLQVIWDKTAANCAEARPAGDSLFLPVAAGGGAQATMLLPLAGGAGRQLLPPGQIATEWSPDGSRLLYAFEDGGASDYGILTLADGSTMRVTQTPEDEGGAEWTADGSALVFRRAVPVSRITTADLTKLLSADH